ncbi:MAG: DNA mismatch repair protein MutS [Candidatus Gracilibacteria bacterium]|nr:DNA mismatch repair protein MutS [Candidatus Gracilibacteria bacterium]
MQDIENIIDLLEKAIKENPENSLTSGEIIADNYDPIVDNYRNTLNNSKDWLVSYQTKLIEETSISTLKIKYTNVSGYFIEIPKSQTSKIPDFFIHKQTLVNASRYITIELKEFEERFLEAQNEKSKREYDIFLEIREKILDGYSHIKNMSDLGANIDFITSLSQVAYEYNYVRPKITNDYNLKIIGGRHPIIERKNLDFISNDLDLDNKKFINIITGPNMGGKSTFLRQNALIILLSHIGSFVPARTATIPLTDKIFSRVGAQDNLFLGQSTFMVEMQEVANILNNSTNKSFVIIDEVGRGTSTYDGMSLAWAILKENHDNIKAKTLFATHYHELIDESKNLTGVSNFSVAVGENDENLVFLRKIIPGGIKKSFGLEVAKIAGLSQSTITEARKMLKKLELEHSGVFGNQLTLGSKPIVEIVEKEVFYDSEVEQELKKIDLDDLTPIQALNKLNELKGMIKIKQ